MGGGGAPSVVSRCIAMPSLFVRQSQASKDMNMEAEETMSLEAVTRQPVKTAD
jgi:hypothetical protein